MVTISELSSTLIIAKVKEQDAEISDLGNERFSYKCGCGVWHADVKKGRSALLCSLFVRFGGTGFLTIGISGILRQYFKSNQSLFTILIAISIPSLILMPVLYCG
jgi:hypothetical protein